MAKKHHRNNELDKSEFLYNAINDVAGNIRFIDTKIALILASLGVIIGTVLTCRVDLYFVYSNWYKSQLWILLTLLFFFLLVISTIFCSLLCLIPRYGKDEVTLSKSFWYFNPTIEYKDFNDFSKNITNFPSVELQLSKELYKLNVINQKKCIWSRFATIFFGCTCFSTVGFFLISSYYYLFLY